MEVPDKVPRLSLFVAFVFCFSTRATIELLRYASFWPKMFLESRGVLTPKNVGSSSFLFHKISFLVHTYFKAMGMLT